MSEPVIAFDPNLLGSNVPNALRALRQWVVWKYVERAGKQTKCPISPTKGGSASSTNPSTWGTFEQAVAACRRSKDLAGVGFVFSSNDLFAGVDLDNCIDDTGQVKPWARSILDQLGVCRTFLACFSGRIG